MPYYFSDAKGNTFTSYMTEIYLLHLLIAALVLPVNNPRQIKDRATGIYDPYSVIA